MADGLHRLVVGGNSAVFDVRSGLPELVFFGAVAEPSSDYLFDRVVPLAGLDHPAAPTLLALGSRGWFGEPGVVATREGRSVPLSFPSVTIDQRDEEILFHSFDSGTEASVVIRAGANGSGVLALSTSLTNRGTQPLGIDALNVTFPVPDVLDDLIFFGGRHAMEFCEERTNWGRTVVTVASRRGRSSHQQSPTVFLVGNSTTESHGRAIGLHLAHSGNFRIVCDAVTGDHRTVTAGEILSPGEVILQPGETYETPALLVASSGDGLTDITLAFHRHFRLTQPLARTPRPVVVNTWEAVYFDQRSERLFELAERAARVGAERFVLDDGWFRGRRSDTAGLGDWFVDEGVWPNGLRPLTDHVESLGMDFGIWVEPEMVNTDSDLFRAHPDWVLGTVEQRSLTGRNQLVLDLSRVEVRDYLVQTLGRLLSDHSIAHVKWDHNRELVSERSHSQTKGVHEVIRRLQEKLPNVDFESCASGGGRIDGGMARRMVRFWTSDSIDALDRLSIQKGAVRVFPPEMLGAHVGAPRCHTTGRHHHLGFRALSALPFWFGIEWNLLDASDRELDELASAVSLHKRFRHLFHGGLTAFDEQIDSLNHRHLVTAPDLSEALVVAASLGNGPRHTSPALRIPGLAPTACYRCELLTVGTEPRWALNRGIPRWLTEGVETTGAELSEIGLPMPPLLPASGILVHALRIGS